MNYITIFLWYLVRLIMAPFIRAETFCSEIIQRLLTLLSSVYKSEYSVKPTVLLLQTHSSTEANSHVPATRLYSQTNSSPETKQHIQISISYDVKMCQCR